MKFQQKGFTLLEVLTVVAIILIISGVTIPNYRSGARTLALERSAFFLANEIRRVEEMAMAGKEVGSSKNGFYPAGGFGVYINKNSKEIIVFADCNGDHYYNPSGKPCRKGANKFPEKIIELKLEKEVQIENLSSGNSLDVVFLAPDPKVFINKSQSGGEATITLSLKSDPSKKRQVKVNSAGLVYVE